QFGGEGSRAVEIDAKSSAGPQQEFQRAFDIKEIGRGIRLALRQRQFITRDISIGLFEGDPNRHALALLLNPLAESPVGQYRRAKPAIERGSDLWRHQCETVV